MADDENEQTTPHWGTSAPDYEGEDPENEIELDPNMAELPLFAGLEAKKIFGPSNSHLYNTFEQLLSRHS